MAEDQKTTGGRSLFPDFGRLCGLLAVSLVAGILLMLNTQRHHEKSMDSRHGWPMIYLTRTSDLLPLNEAAFDLVYVWPLPEQENETRSFSVMNAITNLIVAGGVCAVTYALSARMGRKWVEPQPERTHASQGRLIEPE